MHVVTDTGADLTLSESEMAALKIHVIPQFINIDGVSYRSGVDLRRDELYRRMSQDHCLPTTSTPSAGDFAAFYRRLAQTDPDILSILVPSRLSGTIDTARAGAAMAPEARVTVVDSRGVSVIQGWQVEQAARAVRAGWGLERVLNLVERVRQASEIIFTVRDLRYLVAGGRISHLKGLLASALNIKPLIGFERLTGLPVQIGAARTFSRALQEMIKIVTKRFAPGAALRVQVGCAASCDGLAALRQMLEATFQCSWLPDVSISPILGVHGGPTVVGMAFAPASVFEEMP